MKRIIIDIDDAYANVITFTVIGSCFNGCRVSTRAADLTKHDYFTVDKYGKILEHEGVNHEPSAAQKGV